MSHSLKPLVDGLNEYLKPLGFRRHGLRWNRYAGTFVDVVTIQRTKSQDAVYINLGVHDPEVFERWWRRTPEEALDEADCTVRSRLGVLVDGHDRVWNPQDPHAPDEVTAMLTEYGLPFVESMHSRPMMVEALRGRSPEWPSTIYLALLQASQGDVGPACATLLAFRATTSARFLGLPRLDEILLELGCAGLSVDPATEAGIE